MREVCNAIYYHAVSDDLPKEDARRKIPVPLRGSKLRVASPVLRRATVGRTSESFTYKGHLPKGEANAKGSQFVALAKKVVGRTPSHRVGAGVVSPMSRKNLKICTWKRIMVTIHLRFWH